MCAKLLEWWDYISSTTELKISPFRPEGQAWDVDENGQVFEKLPDSLTDDFTIENYKHTYGMVDYGPLIRKDENAEVPGGYCMDLLVSDRMCGSP